MVPCASHPGSLGLDLQACLSPALDRICRAGKSTGQFPVSPKRKEGPKDSEGSSASPWGQDTAGPFQGPLSPSFVLPETGHLVPSSPCACDGPLLLAPTHPAACSGISPALPAPRVAGAKHAGGLFSNRAAQPRGSAGRAAASLAPSGDVLVEL